MSKVIKCKLDTNSLQKAIDELEEYQDELTSKLYRFMDVLIQDGITVANAWLGSTLGDSTDAEIGYGINQDGDILFATVSLEGPDALFIEFGAGIAYNTGTQHPYAGAFGYGVGTYPSKHPPNKAINPGRWVYGHEEDGTPIWSIGTQASMPIYHAAETIRNNAIKRAIEIFRS